MTPATLRRRIEKIQEKMAEDLQIILGSRALLKGSLYSTQLTCGKPNCRCARGERHTSWVFSHRDDTGKLIKVTLSEDRLNRYHGPAEDYRRFRHARACLARRQRDLLKLLNELEASLLVPPPLQAQAMPHHEEDGHERPPVCDDRQECHAGGGLTGV